MTSVRGVYRAQTTTASSLIYENEAEKRLLTANELQMRYHATNFLVWNSLLHAIPAQWKRILEYEKPSRAELPKIFSNFNSVAKCAQWAYPKLLRTVPVTVPEKALGKWRIEFDLVSPINGAISFKTMYAATADFKLRWLQLRIMHRIIPTNSRLCIYGIRPSDSCDRCPGLRESLLHLFWLCPPVLLFWTQLRRALGLRNPLTAPSVILGMNLGNSRLKANQLYVCILLGKWYIWRCRYTKTLPNIQGFTRMCAEYIRVERYSALMTDTLPNFNRDWAQLNEILKNSQHPP